MDQSKDAVAQNHLIKLFLSKGASWRQARRQRPTSTVSFTLSAFELDILVDRTLATRRMISRSA